MGEGRGGAQPADLQTASKSVIPGSSVWLILVLLTRRRSSSLANAGLLLWKTTSSLESTAASRWEETRSVHLEVIITEDVSKY